MMGWCIARRALRDALQPYHQERWLRISSDASTDADAFRFRWAARAISVSHTHMGERVGADLAAALCRHLTDTPARLPDERHRAGGTVVVFPREWLRDPDSRYLRDFPVDIPSDDPELFAAMLAMQHDV
jgi:hypothetical protein